MQSRNQTAETATFLRNARIGRILFPDQLSAAVRSAELHNAMSYPMFASILEAAADQEALDAPEFGQGQMMREPIFYGGEAAYSFQYRDLLTEKYAADDD